MFGLILIVFGYTNNIAYILGIWSLGKFPAVIKHICLMKHNAYFQNSCGNNASIGIPTRLFMVLLSHIIKTFSNLLI